MKLSGWQRLWVLMSAVFLGLVAAYVSLTLPNPVDIPHSQTFYDQLRPELRNLIATTKSPEQFHVERPTRPGDRQKLQEEWDKAEPLYHVKMPNGHVISFLITVPEKDMNDVAREYWRIIEKEVDQRRLRYAFIAFLLWGGSVIILYLLGWSIRWVHRGFKSQ